MSCLLFINLTPLFPLSLLRRGGIIFREGALSPLSNLLSPFP